MYTRMRKALENRKDEGFTLIELLVVIVIIGILAAIAIPIFLHQREKANDAAQKADLKGVATAVETWYVDNNAFPASAANVTAVAGLDAKVTSTDTVSLITRSDGKSYCLKAVNNAGSSSGDWYYDSAAGGLLANHATCS